MAGTEIAVAELGNNRVSVWTLSGDCTRTIGDMASANGALPLRQPFGVLHAHGLLLVSESTTFGRLVVFTPKGEPLQVLSPRGCAALGGMAADAHWVYVLDAEKGHVLAFATKMPANLGAPRPAAKKKPKPKAPVSGVGKGAAAAMMKVEIAAKTVGEAPSSAPGAAGSDGSAPTGCDYGASTGGGGSESESVEGGEAATGSSSSSSGGGGGGSSDGGGGAPPPHRVLANWCSAHAEDPVPSYREKKHLAAKAGLSVKEVSEWFAERKANAKALRASEIDTEAAEAAAALKSMNLDAKRLALGKKLAESLGGFASGGADMQLDAARFRNMSEY